MKNNEEIKEFFDNLATDWQNIKEEYNIREKLISLAGFEPGGVIADIGCGKGVMLEHLLKISPEHIFAIDLSPKMIACAKELFTDRRITFIGDDLLNVTVPALDAAIIFNAYPHFLDKQALARKLSEMIRPGGILVIAHSRGKQIINGGHTGGSVSRVSVPLREAAAEAGEFEGFFRLDDLTDNDEIYFIKMIRRQDENQNNG